MKNKEEMKNGGIFNDLKDGTKHSLGHAFLIIFY